MVRSKYMALAMACALLVAGASPALAAGLNANLQMNVDGRYSGAPTIGSTSADLALHNTFQLQAGTGTGKADLVFAGTRTIAASSSENLDLAGVLTDPLGATLTFVHVKAIYVKASASNTNSVVVGGASSNAFSGPFGGTLPTVTVPPGGAVMLVHPGAGWTVTASTGDILKVANSSSGTGVTYDIVVAGTSN